MTAGMSNATLVSVMKLRERRPRVLALEQGQQATLFLLGVVCCIHPRAYCSNILVFSVVCPRLAVIVILKGSQAKFMFSVR